MKEEEFLVFIGTVVSIVVVVCFLILCSHVGSIRKMLKYQLQLQKKQYLENGGKLTDKQSQAIDKL